MCEVIYKKNEVMELVVCGRRVRKRGRVVEWEKSYFIKHFTCSTTYLRCETPVLNLCLQLCHERGHSSEAQTMTFKLIHDVQIVLLHSTFVVQIPILIYTMFDGFWVVAFTL